MICLSKLLGTWSGIISFEDTKHSRAQAQAQALDAYPSRRASQKLMISSLLQYCRDRCGADEDSMRLAQAGRIKVRAAYCPQIKIILKRAKVELGGNRVGMWPHEITVGSLPIHSY